MNRPFLPTIDDDVVTLPGTGEFDTCNPLARVIDSFVGVLNTDNAADDDDDDDDNNEVDGAAPRADAGVDDVRADARLSRRPRRISAIREISANDTE